MLPVVLSVLTSERNLQMRKLLAAALALTAFSARADVKLPSIISDNMCLQANQSLPIWGKADAGEQDTVMLGDQKETATTSPGGQWRVTLHALRSTETPLEMTVAGKNRLTVKNILVGEVWVASGQ